MIDWLIIRINFYVCIVCLKFYYVLKYKSKKLFICVEYFYFKFRILEGLLCNVMFIVLYLLIWKFCEIWCLYNYFVYYKWRINELIEKWIGRKINCDYFIYLIVICLIDFEMKFYYVWFLFDVYKGYYLFCKVI